MDRYFFHLHECGTVVPDEDGVEYASRAEARSAATSAARDIMAAEVREGRLCLGCYIVVDDKSHVEVMRIDFGDVLEIIGQTARNL